MTPPDPRPGDATCRYGRLHYLSGGAGGIPLVLLHQTPFSSAAFLPLARKLVAERRVIAFDTPGFGQSDPPPAPLSMDAYAAAFADALDEMGERQVDVLGYHTGAYLAAELAIARPDLVRRVSLSGIPFRPLAERQAKLAQTPPAYPDTWPYQGVWRYDAESRFAALTQPVLILQPFEPAFPHWRVPIARIPHATVLEFPHLTNNVFEIGASELTQAIRSWKA